MTAPQRLRERLLAAGDGPRRVVHRGPHAVYVDLDGCVAGVVSARATRVPCALWSAAPDLASVGVTGERAEVRDGKLHLDGCTLHVVRLVDPRVGQLPGLRPSGHQLDEKRLEALVGLGPGLTPLGDDVACGWLLARHAAGAPDAGARDVVRRLAGRTTPVSATLLDCAARGESLPELTAWLRARAATLRSGGAADPRGESAARTALLAVGATSGRGLLTGARLALRPAEPPGVCAAPSSLDPIRSTHDRSVA